MRQLKVPAPTPEQLTLITDDDPGLVVIRGAAGSGKTSTALLRLRYLSSFWEARLRRMNELPVKALVLTFNRTLAGYIEKLTSNSVASTTSVDLRVATAASWAREVSGYRQDVYEGPARDSQIRRLGAALPMDPDFVLQEVDYVLGRFRPRGLEDYLTAERLGRGRVPRVDMALRQRLLTEVLEPYVTHKEKYNLLDWNDVAVAAANTTSKSYHIVIIDEAQDFSTNQLRSALAHLAAPDYSMTLVMDTAQQIYPRSPNRGESGAPRARRTHTLQVNHRNTVEIAAFAAPLVAGLRMDDDGVVPRPSATRRRGSVPTVLVGSFSSQWQWIVNFLNTDVDLDRETVGVLQVKGGGFFDYTKRRLEQAQISYVDLQQKRYWPTGPEAVAVSTLHSAKGLEFDHVIIPGLNAQVTASSDVDGGDHEESLRRLLAMGIGRARKSVVLGYKADDPSFLIDLLDPATFREVVL